jgi:hypothetical protein
MRRPIIVTTDPDVVIAIPAMISGDPHKARLRGRARVFYNDRRWADANHNLRVCSRRNQ